MGDATFPFSLEIDVRGYEIDSWGHVNNAVYLQWLEHARWEMARRFDFSMLFEGVLPLVRHLDLDYQRETKLGDRLRITMWPRKVGTTSFTLGASIRIVRADEPSRVGQRALAATMVLACVRPGEGKAGVPEAWRTHFPSADPGPDVA